MTPAVALLKKKGVEHAVLQYSHDANAPSYGLGAAEKLALSAALVFKTLVVELDTGKLAVAILPVTHTLNMKKVAKAMGTKKAHMAKPEQVERTSGYVLGGVSPLGQKKALPTVLHSSAQPLPKMYVSGGRRGLEIALAPSSLLALTRGIVAYITD